MSKAGVIVFAELDGTHGEMARVVNALQVTREFREAGDEVRLIFDGGGVTSIAALAQPEHRFHTLYEKVQDKVEGACAFCAKAFGVKEQLEAYGVPLLADYKQHPSIKSLVDEGYEVITF